MLKKTLTRLVTLVLLVTLVFALPAIAAEPSDLKTDIIWAHFPWNYTGTFDTEAEWVESIIAKLHEQYPNVNVEFESIPWDNWQAKISTGIASGTGPDIFGFGSWIAANYKDYLYPIDDFLSPEDLADFLPSALDAGKVDGDIYVWPWMHQGVNLIVNLDLCAERGVELPDNPEGDWTLEEFLSACDKLTFDRDGNGKIDVYAFPLYGVDTNVNWGMTSILGNFGGELFSEDKLWAASDNPENLAALEFILQLQDEFQYSPPGAAGLSRDECSQMFINGQIAMGLNTGDFSSALTRAVNEGQIDEPFEFRYMQFPVVPGREISCTRIGPTGYVVFRQPGNDADARREAAMALCSILVSREELLFPNESGRFVPVRSSHAGLYSIYPNYVAAERGKVFFDAIVEETVYEMELMNLYQSVMNHSVTPKEALEIFDQTVNEKIQKIYDDAA